MLIMGHCLVMNVILLSNSFQMISIMTKATRQDGQKDEAPRRKV